ncbi:restriction endonuclease subunit S [Streptomyces cellulosae]
MLRSTEIGLNGSIDAREPALRSLNPRDRARTRLREGDILVVRSSGSDLHLGKAGYVRESAAGLSFSNFLQRLRFTPAYDSRFAWYFLNCTDAKQQIRKLSSTTTGLQNLSGGLISELEIPSPPLQEQRHIADFLDAETTRIDRLISLRQEQLTLLNERSGSLISEALQPDKSEERILVKVGHVCRLHPGISPSALPKADDTFVVRPYLQISNVQSGVLHLENVPHVALPGALANTAKLRRGDVLTTRVGDPDKLGRAAVWSEELADCLFESNIFALRPDVNLLVPEYLALMTRTAYGRHYFESTSSKTTGLASTNTGKILGFRIPLPDVETQRRHVEKVHKALAGMDRVRVVLTRQSAVLRERRQALITAAVTGQLDVSTASGRNVTEGVSA